MEGRTVPIHESHRMGPSKVCWGSGHFAFLTQNRHTVILLRQPGRREGSQGPTPVYIKGGFG